jgi:hypothetical protein
MADEEEEALRESLKNHPHLTVGSPEPPFLITFDPASIPFKVSLLFLKMLRQWLLLLVASFSRLPNILDGAAQALSS